MRAEVFGRIMFMLGEAILVLTFSYHAFARDLSIFAVQKNLQLSPKDPVYHDYYIDGGTDDGLQVGQIVTVVRRIPLHDLSRNRPLGDMHLGVAKLKVIYAQKGSSVARLQSLYEDKKRPVIDYNAVMIGDRIQGYVGDDDGEKEGPQEGEKKEGSSEGAKSETVEVKVEKTNELPPQPSKASNETQSELSSKGEPATPKNNSKGVTPSKSEAPVVSSPTT